ncbi:fibroblast growth factor receptor substrate 3-like [Ruditapes philippinarum]|uniref:fibroblast growth factor receptor substrate 3-like n=1 Tax=Ruditapes philippinarum TaxID=129788 RepID=UPI00295AE491|nr:fibroblast growth factor receptor substrate 3-like [Ruditapes philippinarum]
MGCYLAKNLPRDQNGRIFRVYNVNDLGAEISPGKIEVTENDLIFYQKGKEPIRWPLRCLRRYGFDEELFSFESGRRCPTGSGIYAFKCHRAEELFNLVQEAIQNVGQNAHQNSHLRASQTMVNGTSVINPRPASRPTSLVDPHEPGGIRLSGAGRVNVVPYDQHLYMNQNGSAIQQEDSSPNYINTGPNQNGSRIEPIDEVSALIDFLHDPPMAPAPPKPDTVNYADLDLPRSTENIFDACDGACAMEPLSNGSVVNADNRDSYTGSDSQNGIDMDDVQLNYADLDVFTETAEESAHPNYINLDAEGRIKDKVLANGRPESISVNGAMQNETIRKSLLVRKLSIEQNYANVGAASFTNIPDPSPVSMNPAGGFGSNNGNNSSQRLSNPGELNYIEIDVNKTDGDVVTGATSSAMSVSFTVPDSPSKRTESYAMIDFNRTVALSNSAKPVGENEEGLRKTRHNSTIN